MLQAIAIDDEPVALEVIKKFSSGIPFIELRAVFTHASKAREYLQKEPVDLLFLDIKMPDISGIDFLRSISRPVMTIFTTAYSRHAVECFELDAIDYLLKPFSAERFLKACQKAQEQYVLKRGLRETAPGPATVFIKSGYEQIKVQLDDVLYVEASGNYVQFVLTSGKLLSRLSVTEVEKVLPQPAFIRIHRSYLVARKHISKIEKGTVWINKVALPVSETYMDMLNDLSFLL